jgi:hypothetical protein
MHVFWTADSQTHTRHIFIPLPRDDDRVPDQRQSFGLGQSSLVMASREIAVRYGRPVSLEDVPEQMAVQLTARDETAQETLARQLAPLGLHVTESPAGLLIEKASLADEASTRSSNGKTARPAEIVR